jgi:hypothetical protein
MSEPVPLIVCIAELFAAMCAGELDDRDPE